MKTTFLVYLIAAHVLFGERVINLLLGHTTLQTVNLHVRHPCF